MTLAPFAALEARIAATTAAMLANAVVRLANGHAFGAIFDVADVAAFGGPQIVGDYVIRYLTSVAPDLSRGEIVTVNGRDYRIAGDPTQINAEESVAQLGAIA